MTEAEDGGVRLAIYAASGQRLQSVPAPAGQVFEASWVDDQRVIYVASDGRVMQAHLADLRSQTYRCVTRAPYLSSQPWSDGQRVRFLNRRAWHFSLVEAPLLPAPRPPRGAVFDGNGWSPTGLNLPHGSALNGRRARVVRDPPRALDTTASGSYAFQSRTPAAGRVPFR